MVAWPRDIYVAGAHHTRFVVDGVVVGACRRRAWWGSDGAAPRMAPAIARIV